MSSFAERWGGLTEEQVKELSKIAKESCEAEG